MIEKKKKFYDFVPSKISLLQKGLDYQREIYKQANLRNNYEVMVKCLENIKTEIKSKAIAKGNKNKIKRVERIIIAYKRLPFKFRTRTEEGIEVCYPDDIVIRISYHLNEAYEILIDQLNLLGLI